LEQIFDALIDSYLDTRVGITEDFLSTALAGNLKDNLIGLYQQNSLRNAGTGNTVTATQNKLVRGDQIHWLDRLHNDAHENDFFDLMDLFVDYLNRTCYTGITGYEFHYTLYPEGSFYKTHIDQFKNNSSRVYSMIVYLNTDWLPADGGELCIHHADERLQNIAPVNGKSVFFKSNELQHEVLITTKQRLSITGWLKVG
jgi:SM-20-related protein